MNLLEFYSRSLNKQYKSNTRGDEKYKGKKDAIFFRVQIKKVMKSGVGKLKNKYRRIL